jgi:hypothetical protein
MTAPCLCCGNLFPARRQDQHFCFRPECRRRRKNAFQKKMMKEDSAYRQNQADAQRHWRECHKDYWRRYRESHRWYTERNRRLQRLRNRRRGKRPFLRAPEPVIAKMDAQQAEISGTYRLVPISQTVPDMIAKMDGIVVRLSLVASP